MDSLTSPPALDEFLGASPAGNWRQYRKWAVMALVAIVLLLAGWWFLLRADATAAYATEPVVRGDLFQEGGCAVGRAVIQHEDFQMRIGLLLNTRERPLQACRAVAGGQNH